MEKVSLSTDEYEKWVQIAGKPLMEKWVAEKEAKGLPAQKVLDAAIKLIEKYKVR